MTGTQRAPTPTGPALRYTVRLTLRPGDRLVEFRVVTAMGELKAAAMAALRQARLDSEAFLTGVEIVLVECEFKIDPGLDLLDHWEIG